MPRIKNIFMATKLKKSDTQNFYKQVIAIYDLIFGRLKFFLVTENSYIKDYFIKAWFESVHQQVNEQKNQSVCKKTHVFIQDFND